MRIVCAFTTLALVAFALHTVHAYHVGLRPGSPVFSDLTFILGCVFTTWLFTLFFTLTLRRGRNAPPR